MSGSQELLLGNFVSGGYQISRSLRFNSADSAYLNRTLGTPTNGKIFTFSVWLKRSILGTLQSIMTAQNGGAEDSFAFLSGDTIRLFFSAYSSSGLTTNAVFRDVSAWYHIVLAVDTTQATASNRVKMYVNGVQQTFTGSDYPSQNATPFFNTALQHFIGRYANQFMPTGNFNGYMTEVNFIDGQALTPSSFGQTNSATGVWEPIKYTGTYGTNGFWLQFADNSGTTSTTLGKDTSGNSNNWTPNNFSVTAGDGNDSLVDSPTQYGTDTGAGGEVRGNYCTLSPVYALNVTYNTPTNGNLDVALSNNSGSYGTFSFTTGKWYWEITVASAISSAGYVGLMDSTFIKTDNTWSSQARNYVSDGSKYNGSTSAYGATWGNGDIIGVAVNMDAGTIVFYKNGSSQGTAFSDLIGKEWKPMVWAPSGTYTLNFGQRPFAYTAPSGFKALCTTNLPTPTIGATSTTQANDYFNAVLYTGNGYPTSGTQSITGVGFQPDFVWIKNRSNVGWHTLTDAVRGVNSQLFSNTTSAQETNTDTVTAFNTDGFSLGANTTGSTNSNVNTQTYVAWNWNAGGSNQTISVNQYGSTPSIASTVRANTTAGFSIVTYTGNATAGATIGHGLGATPSMIIVKDRVATSGAREWVVYHSSLGNTKAVFLSTTGAAYTGTNLWNNTSPTSAVFTVGNSSEGTNGSGNAMIAYCFAAVAGYSAFGSYTGNGSTDGPFIYTGFRPEYVLIKPSTVVDSWQVEDAARSPFNTVNDQLFPNTSDAEQVDSATRNTDFLSNGFKLRGTNGGVNGSGTTYIYAAFAEFPFKYTLAR